MSNESASISTRFRVGLFTLITLAIIGVFTIFVNDKPFWWRECNQVHINVADATGLRMKSPVRSLGLQIGYLTSVTLQGESVRLGICITAPVEITPQTRAYIKGEGFLGDKFVELKPVRYVGEEGAPREPSSMPPSQSGLIRMGEEISAFFFPKAWAGPPQRPKGREIPVGEQSQDVQELVNEVDSLVQQMTSLTSNLKEAINPKELRQTMTQLNKTLEHASRTLSPEGGLNTTAQRTLAKLEDGIEQLRDLMTRVNRGEGSVGMLLNDPSYAEEVKKAVINLNLLLGKVSALDFIVDIGAVQLNAYDGARAWANLAIWPEEDRYYLLGVAADPRGALRLVNTTTTTFVNGTPTGTVETQTREVEPNRLVLTAMLGKVLWSRIDLAAGARYGDGAVSVGLALGPGGYKRGIYLRNDIYARSQGAGLDIRSQLEISPVKRGVFSNLYVIGGIESLDEINGTMPWFFGAGVMFDDEYIKMLFALR